MKTISKKSGGATKTATNVSGGNRPDAARAKLETLANEIQSGHRQCVEALRGVVTQAAAIGTLLIEAKKLVGHGGWKAWVKDHCKVAMRMAQNYMLVARSHDRIVAKFGNDTAGWTLTDFINLARKFEVEGRDKPRSTAPQAGTSAPTKPTPFRLPEEEVTRRERRFREEVRGAGIERVANEKAVAEFVREKVDALYAAVRRFVGSKEVEGLVADGLDAADVGMLLVESLKSAINPVGVLLPQVKVEPAVVPAPQQQPIADEAGKYPTNGKHHPSLTL